VLANGDRDHGSTVHFVTEDLDAGPMVIQARLEIAKEETESTLCQRVQKMEYRIYPLAIKWFSENRLRIKNSRAYLDENEGLPKIIDEVGRI
jgi:phosphoribosylglycinamide formyltransferase-1